VCWGTNDGSYYDFGQSTPPSGTFTSVSAGGSHTCALTVAGEAVCWGSDSYGQSTAPANGLTYQEISAGGAHTCALTTAGEAVCWGYDDSGQTMPPANGLTYQTISAGDAYTCALTLAGEAVCWGSAPSLPINAYQSIVATGYYGPTCALTLAGKIACSDGLSDNSLTYKAITTNCGLTTGGELRCWAGGPWVTRNTPVYPNPVAWSADIGVNALTIGEFTGDDYLDIIVGNADAYTSSYDAYSGDTTILAHGWLQVLPGSASGFVGEVIPSVDATHTLTGSTAYFQAGKDLINAGDINGDGFDDLVSNGKLYYGPLSPGDAPAEGYDASFPGSPIPLGDIDRDGFDDVLVDGFIYYGEPN
jgi:hypothetical protein